MPAENSVQARPEMPRASRPLRLNQGNPTEARVYYCPHFVAAELSLFERAGVEVELVWSGDGGDAVKGGQVPALLRGEADVTIGGPMVTMRMLQDEGRRLINFCAAVAVNPWFLVGREPVGAFSWEMLRGRSVFDIANIPTASLCFRWLLRRLGLADGSVEIRRGSGDDDLAAFVSGTADFAIHSLHALGPLLAEGRVHVIADLAGPTGRVPWSSYITLPETRRLREADLVCFARAIGAGLGWMREHSVEDVVDVIGPYYPGYPRAGLAEAIERYRSISAWPDDAFIPQQDFDRFAAILTEAGWLKRPVAYKDQVDPTIARDALRPA